MSEKDYPQEPIDQEPVKKTIDLAEWQVKNEAYLAKRAREKVRLNNQENDQKVATDAEDEAVNLELEDSLDTEMTAEEPIDALIESDEQELESQDDLAEEDELTEAVANTDENDQDHSAENLVETDKAPSRPIKKNKKKRLRKPIPYRLIGFFLAIGLIALLAAYFVLPVSRIKQFKVSGQSQVSQEQVLVATGLKQSDYTLTTLLKSNQVAKSIASQLVWVDQAQVTYTFPFEFDVTIKEHSVVGYVKDGSSYYPVLSSGDTIDAAVAEEALPDQYLLFKLTDLSFVREFVHQLREADLLSIVGHIQSIELAPTQATNDLLSVTTQEGHTVLVPLSEVGKKMIYYAPISQKLTVASVIDMEAGIFTYSK